MERLLQTVSEIARVVAAEFVDRGGRITGAGEDLTPDDFADVKGALGPVFWMAGEFFRDFQAPFPFATYESAANALPGYRVCEIPLREHNGALTLYMFSDFLRKELLVEQRAEIDLSSLFESFREWCDHNVGSSERAPSQNRDFE